MKRLVALLLLLASPALAQVSNPSRPDLREEGVSQGRIFALDCIGTELLCAVSGGVGSITFSGANLLPPFSDAGALVKGSADPTKLLAFEVDGFTGGTTRTITVPDVSDTMALLGANQTYAGTKTYNPSGADLIDVSAAVDVIRLRLRNGAYIGFGTGTSASTLGLMSPQTPDTLVLTVPPISNHAVLMEEADRTFDRAIPLQTSPTLFVVPPAQNTTQRMGLAYYGSQGRAIKTLTETTATSAVRIPVASGAGAGGMITFTAFASDGTDHQTLTGVLQYAAVNKAGTESCSTPTLVGTGINSNSTGTLTCTYACSTAPTNAVDIQFNCTSSLTQSTLDLYYRLNAMGADEPLPQ